MTVIAEMAMTTATAAVVAKTMAANNNDNRCHGGGSERGDKVNAGGGRLGPTTPFVLNRTNCRVSLSLLGAGRTSMLEVLLCASFVVALSSESAAPATTPVNVGVKSAAASADQEELARIEQRICGDDPEALCLPMGMGIPNVSASSPSLVSRAIRRQMGPPPMALVSLSRHQRTKV